LCALQRNGFSSGSESFFLLFMRTPWSDDAILKKRPQNGASAGRKTNDSAGTLPGTIPLCYDACKEQIIRLAGFA
jgi:hypothetical protein